MELYTVEDEVEAWSLELESRTSIILIRSISLEQEHSY